MDKKNKLEYMKKLIIQLNKAAKAYYLDGMEIMSNFEYDKLYDELTELERETGVTMADSPTVNVGYEILEELPKEKHEKPMLSLNKTKDTDELAEFAGDRKSLLSWKLDGLTIVLTFRDGKLFKAVTRGNGEIGEVITNNARVFKNIPVTIPYKGELILRGEALIKYSDFEKINSEIEDVLAKYKNPRNLCSGTVRQLNNEVASKRCVYFFAFSLVKADNVEFGNSRENQLKWLQEMGFDIVEYKTVTKDNIHKAVNEFSEAIQHNDFPSDGLVLMYDDIEYSASLGHTAKFPRDSIAFKWKDETAKTVLTEIEWSASRTGLINPVAIFEPVELEGTTVSRASVHNLSVVEELKLGIGDEILVYKANMIIPQIAENFTGSKTVSPPTKCPVCNGETVIRSSNDVKYLYCTNQQCQAKKIKSFVHMCGRDALNIEGLSEATLEKFLEKGFIKNYSDIYDISRFKDEIVNMEGFGEKSYENIIDSIEKSKSTSLDRFIYSLGITNIGLANAKMLLKAFNNNLEELLRADAERLSQIDGVGSVIAESFISYFNDESKHKEAMELLEKLDIIKEENLVDEIFANMNFVVTGSVALFSNRNEVKAYIEQRGGKVTGTVSKNTNYLINNDINSTSSKNKKAKELGVPIITEQQFLNLSSN